MTEFPVQITCDSTADLSDALYQKYQIAVSPLYINTNEGQSYQDGVNFRPEDIYAYVDRTGELTKTSACTVEDYLRLFRQYTDTGKQVVHINISSEFSSCYQNACIARDEIGGGLVEVVDSRNLSTGTGHAVLEAAEMAAQNKNAGEIAAWLRTQIIPCVEASFVIDQLRYLKMGGRCSSIVALGANLLKLKPCIEVTDGKMSVGKKYRGSLAKALTDYVSDRLQGRTDINRKRVFVTHTACDPAVVQQIVTMTKELGGFEEIIETTAGCTITNHCGPGTLGILFLRNSEK
ncbi:MAG TPA: DegV family protein [Firmicutes bacterium]|nr:DegV family protein [Bacillota bacterium]